ncbi:MAG: putative oxidoreductase [Frankiales bacterium]|jgi:pyridoxine 4-dehydrogenase|nr:putative oxidoreductase [Frankiales bacterium]
MSLSFAGRDVPRLGYGTMRLTGPRIFGPPAYRDEAVRVVRRAVELGVRVVDTAWYYGPYVANEVLAEAVHPYDDLVLVSKLGGARRDDGSWYAALTPDELRTGIEHDLRTLRVESIPVVHLRWMPDASVPFGEALGAMVELREAGKLQHIGLSNVSLAQLEAALDVTPVVSVSNAYSVLSRGDDAVLERCTELGIAYLPFFPLGASPVRSGAGTSAALEAVAELHDATVTQVALAWLLQRSPVVLPIPGTSSVAHLEENLAAPSLVLTPEDLAELG